MNTDKILTKVEEIRRDLDNALLAIQRGASARTQRDMDEATHEMGTSLGRAMARADRLEKELIYKAGAEEALRKERGRAMDAKVQKETEEHQRRMNSD